MKPARTGGQRRSRRDPSLGPTDPVEDFEVAESNQAEKVDRALVAKSSRQTAVAQFLTQALRLLTNIALARLLTPADFGVVAVALVATSVLDQVRDLGTGSAVIQRREVDRVLLSSVFYLNLALGVVAATALVLLAGPVAAGLGNPVAAPVVQCFGVLLVITALGQVQQSLLRRRMQFRKVAVITVVQGVVTAVVSLALALAGLNYWALVIGTASGTVLATVMLWVVCPWRPELVMSLDSIRSIWTFSWQLFLTNVLFIIWSQVDKVIVGRFAGGVGLGTYTVAQRLVQAPLTALYGVIGEVSFSAFSRRQDDHAALRSGFTRSAAVVALVTFPLMAGAVVMAGPFVEIVLGSKWEAAIPVIVALAPAGAVQSVTFNSAQILFAKGRADWAYKWGLLHLALLAPLEIVGSRWGVAGVAWGYTVGVILIAPFTLLLTFRLIELRMATYLRALLPLLAYSLVMVGAVLGARALLDVIAASVLVHLIVGFGVGVATYGALLWLRRPQALTDVLSALRGRQSA